ncbi:hypothetical protein SAMN05443550_105160 [Pedobacter hartonius]|uniref:Uncharacterized protein n=1 Tax=Pedobacter hartonius TaxID=425514 RepID=A0A1H4DY84_9SPHI|nr:hypothetical protein SAMN05443550_105160 [Pedobacter hartonius]
MPVSECKFQDNVDCLLSPKCGILFQILKDYSAFALGNNYFTVKGIVGMESEVVGGITHFHEKNI